ncbi:replication protein RepO, partial [Salmonella enterica subsp. enterica serovar Newport]|nr:replication protein RepO [Salmonella enterica subsp. enterica serovar Newport]
MSNLLINESPLQVLPTLACAIGLNEAVIVQQMHYWMKDSQHFYDGRRWIYNSVASWQKQFPFW